MLVVTGTFENERFIPDRPISILQKKKAVVIIEENPDEVTNPVKLTKAQVEEWSKTPDIQALVGALKDAGLAADISLSDIRNERLAEKYKT